MLTSKPSWSVLSLPDLNEAIRRARDPSRLRAQERERLESERLREDRARADRADAAARAKRDRYRNDWEHT